MVHHQNSITQSTLTSSMSFMNFSLDPQSESISPRRVLFVVDDEAHSRYFRTVVSNDRVGELVGSVS